MSDLAREIVEAVEREAIAKTIAMDLLNAVQAIYGDEGLAKVAEHARRANKVREDNAEMDALEKSFSNLEH